MLCVCRCCEVWCLLVVVCCRLIGALSCRRVCALCVCFVWVLVFRLSGCGCAGRGLKSVLMFWPPAPFRLFFCRLCCPAAWGLGFGVWGLGFGVWGSGFGAQGWKFCVGGLGIGHSSASCSAAVSRVGRGLRFHALLLPSRCRTVFTGPACDSCVLVVEKTRCE